MMIRVDRRVAMIMYYSGCSIYLPPCDVAKAKDSGVPHKYDYLEPTKISFLDKGLDFYQVETQYIKDNCCYVVGYIPYYYITEKDYQAFEMCKLMCD